MPMKSLPQDMRPYKRTSAFSREAVPPGLSRNHSTKAGVWGVIHVVQGLIIYRRAEPAEEHLLKPGRPGVVEPQVLHSVELSEDAEFYVEFWKAKSA